jgi:hypothetical protein
MRGRSNTFVPKATDTSSGHKGRHDKPEPVVKVLRLVRLVEKLERLRKVKRAMEIR